ncbi:MAG: sporulation integral membrane protein YlbJ [Desulfitobacterium sp.]|nr:sporulation integral membrane protein YlbJ [Desulfitobacterium sp.]
MTSIIRILPFLFLALSMFYYPQEVVNSASNGLQLWWEYVIPALLPFFILSELLLASGFVHFLGVMLEPLMRPLFRLPGQASFVVAMSFTSGIPIGAILTSKLRNQKILTQEEGERLLAFTCNPSPGFMFGAVASGMLGRPELGIVIAGSIYLANLLVGIVFRFYRVSETNRNSSLFPSPKIALRELQKAQRADSRPFGKLLGDAVKQSINNILMVGGFLVFFSVFVGLLEKLKITYALGYLSQKFTGGFLSFQEVSALVTGFLETTLGCESVISSFTTLDLQIAILVGILGWGGLSVFAQVASFSSTTDLKFAPFVYGRILQSLFAVILSQLFLSFIEIPVFQIHLPAEFGFWESWQLSSWIFCFTMSILLILSLSMKVIKRR